MPDIDLDNGDPDAAEKILSGPSGGARRTTTTRKKVTQNKSPRVTQEEERAFLAELKQTWVDLAEAFRENDPELADILDRRGAAMSNGIISVTRRVTFLRKPVVLFLAFVQPVLGFWELGSLFLGRFITRRERKAFERQQQQHNAAEPGVNQYGV